MVELQDGEQTAGQGQESEGTPEAFDAVGMSSSPSVAADDVDAVLNKLSIPRHLPSITDIKKALPQHVFDPCVGTSMFYALRDVLQVAVTFFTAEWVWSSGLLPTWLLLLLVPGYLLVQGTFFTAIFVVGHDAGHSSFSHHDWLNDLVGNVMHTFVLCPYYCWKLSHRNHHKNTGNMDKDEVYYPIRKKVSTRTPVMPGFGLGAGWFKYLVNGYGPRGVHHFNPMHPMLRSHAVACAVSITLVIGWVAALRQYMLIAGFTKLLIHYILPECICASFLVILTFLHHTDEDIPWYGDAYWNFVRGQLSSVDRHYGWCHDIIHSIGTHQIHHLFSKIPHYHLEEATRVFRPKFPQLVQVRESPILPAFCRMFAKYAANCVVDDSTKVHVY